MYQMPWHKCPGRHPISTPSTFTFREDQSRKHLPSEALLQCSGERQRIVLGHVGTTCFGRTGSCGLYMQKNIYCKEMSRGRGHFDELCLGGSTIFTKDTTKFTPKQGDFLLLGDIGRCFKFLMANPRCHFSSSTINL